MSKEHDALIKILKRSSLSVLQQSIEEMITKDPRCSPFEMLKCHKAMMRAGVTTTEFTFAVFVEPFIRECCEKNGWTYEEYQREKG